MKKRIIKGQFSSKIDIGCVRVTNEDQAISLVNSSGNVLLCVCDGMGGHNKGDYASRLAIDILSEEFRKKNSFISNLSVRYWLSKTIKKINKQIYYESENDPTYKGMGTTIVLALLYNEQVFVLNAGDSRAYFVRYNDLKQLSEDQTYVDYLYNTGKISREEMSTSPQRHILMNALGTFPSASYSLHIYQNLGSPIILCSDGLYNNATEKEIHSALHTNETIEQKLETLISIAKNNGGSDNIAVSYWEAIDNGKNW